MHALLDNVFWGALTGVHARFAAGEGGVRRYARGFSPIAAFEDQRHPDFDALVACVLPDEMVYMDGIDVPLPAGWRLDVETKMFKMVWQGGTPDRDPGFAPVPLGAGHRDEAMALATLTRPGPFGPRTIELGDYFGVFHEGRLVAMAGERTHVEAFHEVSGVCTHPDHQGRGLARKLVAHLVARHVARGETSFLHVMSANTGARALYDRMGFRDYREVGVRAVTWTGTVPGRKP